jgi:hypothetical protein
MTKKCLYCKTELPETSVIDFCESCGVGVWGQKMFNTIVSNMEEARESGDLCHGSNSCNIPEEKSFSEEINDLNNNFN